MANLKKRVYSIILAIVMVVTMIPATNLTNVNAAVAELFWPVRYANGSSNTRLSSHWYPTSSGHNGIDVGSAEGCNWYAAYGGTVYRVFTGCSSNGYNTSGHTGCRPNYGRNWQSATINNVYYSGNYCNYGFGNGVVIQCQINGSTYYMQYAHMNSVSGSLREGQYVSAGTYLGTVGNRGFSFGTHAHFEIDLYKMWGTRVNNDPTQGGCQFTYNYSGGGGDAKPSISPESSIYKDDHNIVPKAVVYNPNRSKMTTVGIEIKDGGNVIAKKEEQFVASANTAAKGNISYNCVSECGVTLRSGHTYTWNIYCYVGGTRVETGWQSIKTTGTEIPSVPTFTTPKKDYAVGDAATISWGADANATGGYSLTIQQISGGDYTKTLTTGSSNATSLAFTLPTEGEYKVTGYARGSGNSAVSTMSRTVIAHGPNTVKFVETFDDDSTNVLCEQTVKYGYSAQAPSGISRKGHTFLGWDGEYSQITKNTVITAKFKRNTYKINFFDKDGSLIKTELVLFEGSATAPTAPEPELGYVFAGWDNEDYKNVQGNVDVKACYVWANNDLPVVITLNSCEFKDDGYVVNYNIKNNPDSKTKGRALVSLRTSTGKLLDTMESNAFSLAKGETKSNIEVYVPYEGAATNVSLYIINGYTNGIPISQTASIEVSRDWSDWSGEEPDSNNEIETRAEYRTKDQLTTTTRTSVNDGWTLNKTVLDSAWTYGAWSGWSRNAYYANSTTTTLREVQTQSVQDSSAYTLFNWYYYRYWNSSAGTYYYTYSSSMGGTLYTWQTSYWLPQIGTYSGHAGYKPAGGKNFAGEIWFLGSTQNVPATYHTEWRYRDATKGYTYYWNKWDEWSNWSPTEAIATDTKQVETRTAYRYRANMSDLEDNSGIEYKVNGSIDKSLVGKEVLMQVYKGNEPSDSNIEYIGRVTINEDGSYSHKFIPREEISAATGDYTITLAIEGGTEPIYLDKIESPKPQYTVTFKDFDGNIIDHQTVTEGDSATAPQVPERENYYFVGWDFGVTNIRDNMEIVAQYAKNKYSVAFVNWDTREVDTAVFSYGDAVVYPDVTEIEGYDFVNWTTTDGNTIENITDNTVLVANYKVQTYTINFFDKDNELLSSESVVYGHNATPPEEPQIDKMEFMGWSDYGYVQAKGDVDVYPTYQYIETTTNPTCDLESGVLSETTDIHLLAEEGAKIYYTTDGTMPTILSNEYDGKITIDKNVYLQYLAVSPEKNESQVMNASYLLISAEDDEGALVIKRDSYNVKRGNTAKVSYFLSHEDPNIGVEYYSLNEDVASIDEEGNVKANQVGETKIFVRTSDSRYADYCDIIVTTDEVDAETITLSDYSLVVLTDSIIKIDSTVSPADVTDPTLDWYSENENVATVNSEGTVTVVGEGRTVIKAISKSGTCYAECVVEGRETLAKENIAMSDTLVVLKEGGDKQLNVYYGDTALPCTWYSSNEEVVAVDKNGNLTALRDGYAVITAVTEEGITNSCTVIVEKKGQQTIEGGIEINGYQINAKAGGIRTVYSVDSTIGGKEVTESGLVYSLEKYAADSDMFVNTDNQKVFNYTSTEKGKCPITVSESDFANSFAMTMKFGSTTTEELTTVWKIRAYAKLSDGSYVYSDIHRYTIFNIADMVYRYSSMNNETNHNYVYTNILQKVNADYEEVSFNSSDM